MSLSQRLSEYIAAAFAGLWIQSHEHDDALTEIGRLCAQKHWALAVWDIDRGLQLGAGGPGIGADSPEVGYPLYSRDHNR